MKVSKKFMSVALASLCMASSAVPAFATTTPVAPGTTASQGLDAESTIPVTISAEPTVFNVEVPTSLPIAVDPVTGESLAPDAVIKNNSSAPVYVSNITVNRSTSGTYADSSGFTTPWTLGGFDADLRNEDVDANKVGVAVSPVGGRAATAAGAGTQLKTSGAEGKTLTEVLLNSKSAEWVIDATDGQAGGSDELTLDYATNVTPVSKQITNAEVANIVITIAWNK